MTRRARSIRLAGGALALALAIAGVAVMATPRAALAHAAYESSSPSFGEVLEASPAAIELRFTQELFRRQGANTITLTDADGGTQALGETVVENDDRRRLTAAVLSALPRGRYLVSWTNLSADDGDDDDGVYPFYVGRDPTPDEVAADRAMAADLLIPYPGDSPEPTADGAPDAPPPPTPLAADPDGGGGDIGGGVWALGALGLVAASGVAASRFRHWR